MYLLGNPPDYEQPPENALGPQARRQGRQPEELAYEAMLTDEGRGMLYVPFLNYADGNLDARARCCAIRSACRASPTAARIAASSATPASRPIC
jgi:hypothetical protein